MGECSCKNCLTVEKLRKDVHRVGEAFLRSREKAHRLELENLELRLRLIRLRRLSGLRGVAS